MFDSTCSHCKFSESVGGGDFECHFNAPLPRYDRRESTYWPIVHRSDWCGKFEITIAAPAVTNGERDNG